MVWYGSGLFTIERPFRPCDNYELFCNINEFTFFWTTIQHKKKNSALRKIYNTHRGISKVFPAVLHILSLTDSSMSLTHVSNPKAAFQITRVSSLPVICYNSRQETADLVHDEGWIDPRFFSLSVLFLDDAD